MLFLKRESREIIIGIILASCVKWEAEINETKLRFDFATSETQRYSKAKLRHVITSMGPMSWLR